MNFKKLLPLCLTVLSLGLASCVDNGESTPAPRHEHSYATEWSKDSTHHWHPCTGENCEVVNDRAAHRGGNATCTAKAVCEDCGEAYGEVLAHNYDQKAVDAKYLKSEATHLAKALYYYSCVCGEKGTTTFEVGETVAHSKAEAWSSNATNHWKACTATGCEDIKLDSAAHAWKDVVDAKYLKDAATCTADAVYYKSCEVCGYKGTETFTAANTKVAHTYGTEWKWDVETGATGHYHVCTAEGCNAKDQVVAHTPGAAATEDDPQLCTDCGFVLAPATGHIIHTADTNAGIQYNETNHWYNCIGCSTEKVDNEAHHGGEATCTAKAVCEDCGKAYGELAAHTYVEEVAEEYLVSAADCDSKAVYKKSCSACGVAHETETFEYGEFSHVLPEGYLLTIGSGSTLKYLEIIPNGTFINVVFAEKPTNYWTYDADLKTFAMNVNGTNYILGTQNSKTYDTFSAIKVAEASSAFIAYLYNDGDVKATEFAIGSSYKIGMEHGTHGLMYVTGAMDGYYYESTVNNPATSTSSTAAAVTVRNVTWEAVPYTRDETNHWQACANCEAKVNSAAHNGGTATCQDKAVCADCGKEYGSLADHVYGTEYSNNGSNQHGYMCTTEGCGEFKEGSLVDHNFVSGTCSDCGATEGSSTVVFDFGTNGATGHVDGDDIGTSKQFTSGSASITLTNASKVYDGGKDEKGNSFIKLGTSSVVGTFTLTVDANTTKVVFYVAGYKAKTSKITINGTQYTVPTSSNNGAYTAYEVDTTTTKTITFATVSGATRVCIDKIELVQG